jgi:MFS family permease
MADPARIAGVNRKHFLLLFAATLVSATGNTAMQSIIPSFGRSIGLHDLTVTLMFSVSAMLWAICAPLWGRRADVMDRKTLLRVGLCGYAVSKLIVATVIFCAISGWLSLPLTVGLFIFGRAFYGIFGSAAPPAAQAFVADRTSPADRTYALGLLASAFGLGTVLGPAIAPLIVMPPLGIAGPLFFFAGMALLILLRLNRELPPDLPATRQQAQAETSPLRWRDPHVARLFIYAAIMGSVQAALMQTLGFLIIDSMKIPPLDAIGFVSLAMMAGAFATLLAQWGLIRLLDLDSHQLLWSGALLGAGGCLLLALGRDYHLIVTGVALASLGFGFARPGISGACSLAVARHHQGDVAGKITGLSGAVFILGPALGLTLYKLDSHLAYGLMGAAMAILALPWFRQTTGKT